MAESPSINSLLKKIQEFLRDRFNFDDDKASEKQTIEEIKKSVIFKGTKLWILIFAIMVASIGLNVNSPAVVIGAMLISPLMGPIMGIGLGVGIFDINLIIKSVRNLLIAVVISVITSAFYFWISPLNDAQSELLARTSPTLWDVLIALFGGLAGIVAGSRKEKSNAIPGVAIATALMPPLCTAGFGLATANWTYFFGAFYLFFINSVFISFSTYLIVRVLNFKQKEFIDPKREKRIKLYIYIFILITILPSIYTAYNVVKDNLYERKVSKFIRSEFNFSNTKIIDQDITYGDTNTIDITLYGEPISDEIIARIKSKKDLYYLHDSNIKIRQGHLETANQDIPDLEVINQKMRAGIIEDLYKKNEEILETKEEQIKLLQDEIIKIREREIAQSKIAKEVIAINKNILEFSLSNSMITKYSDSISVDTSYIAYLKFKRPPNKNERTQLLDWLKVRTDKNNIRLIVK